MPSLPLLTAVAASEEGRLADAKRRKSKSRTQTYIDSMELEAEGERPFRRSRTGCLTCRKRKKKCPEQYDGASCLRCKAGGWKCVRDREASVAGGTPRQAFSDQLEAGPPLEAGPSTAPSATPPTFMPSSLSCFGSPSLFADFSITSTGPAFVNTPYSAGLGPSRSQPDDLFAGLAPPQPESATSGWTLDDLLGATLPDFDISQYTNLDISTPRAANAEPRPGVGITDVPANHEPADLHQPSGPGWPASSNPFQVVDPASTAFASLLSRSTSGADERAKIGPLLETFYDQYILPAWAVTYPSPVREAIVADYHCATNRHRLNRLCRQAAGASYLALLQRNYGGEAAGWLRKRKTSEAIPAAYLNLSVDAEKIIREATLMARNPKDLNLTLESHLTALEDLHMGVGAFCESNRAFAIMELAEQLLVLAYGPHPTIDLESKYCYLPFNLRAFAMIDINRSLCHRRTTFFNFDNEPDKSQVAGHVNDGSHDNWFGLPSTLAVYFARVNNLVAIATKYTNGPVPASIRQKAIQLEDQIRTFRAPFTLFDPVAPRHPFEYTAEFAIETELWRNLSIVLLCRYVIRDSAFSTEMRRHTSLVFDLLKALPSISNPRTTRDPRLLDWWSLLYTTPAFIVGSMSVDLGERQFVREYLQGLGTEKALEDMLVILEMTWMKTDSTGVVADWFEEAKALDLGIIFF